MKRPKKKKKKACRKRNPFYNKQMENYFKLFSDFFFIFAVRSSVLRSVNVVSFLVIERCTENKKKYNQRKAKQSEIT